MATHGEIFRQKREQLSMTQQELAKALGVAQTTISGVETGKFVLSISRAKKFAGLGMFNWVELYETGEEERVPAIEANQ